MITYKCSKYYQTMLKKSNVRISTLFFLLVICIFLASSSSIAKKKEVTLTKIGEFRIGGVMFDVELEDDIAYVAEYSRSLLHIIDISDPSAPFELGNFSVNLPHYFDVRDGIAYIAAWDHGLQIFNVSDPNNPVRLSEFKPPGFVGGIHISDNYLFVGATNADVHLLDVSDPSNPSNISSFNPGGTIAFFKRDDIVFMLSWSTSTETSNLVIADYSDPLNPFEVGRINLGEVSADLSVIGDIVITACMYGGFKILNCSDLENPEIISTYDEEGAAYALEEMNDIIYLANGYRGLELFDISDKSQPVNITRYSTGGYAEELKIEDDLVYLLTNGLGIEIIRVQGLSTSKANGFDLSLTLIIIPLLGVLKRRKKEKDSLLFNKVISS